MKQLPLDASEKRPIVILKPGKEKPILNRHPWVFSGAIARVNGEPAAGDIVQVADTRGVPLATGYFNPRSQIVIRLLSWKPEQPIDRGFWLTRLRRAIAGRHLLGLGGHSDNGTSTHTTAYRLVNAESDGLPGLIVDRYGDFLATQFLTLGADRRREELADLLMETPLGERQPAGLYRRDDAAVRQKEGLDQHVGPLRGDEPPDELEIWEAGRRFLVDIKRGQKTGFYLDQRENRARVAAYAAGRQVLNGFAYTGAFAIYAAQADACNLLNLDVSADALGLCARNLLLNGLDHVPAEHVVGDIFQELRRYRTQGRRFDLVILDPPKFATSQAQVPAAARGYKDINLLAMQLLRADGILASFSCSGLISMDLFQKILFGAGLDAGRDVQVLETLSQAGDHPLLLSFPESAYLKGFICRVA